ncbi:hypothetical protein GLOIN_2v1083363 [Rhizophagus irregularis DAOM 181602=DAOM 197198]|nr:hypothetical protein GLOIN_2v1083363 [Rhizophagus irregularis DAOM 181602=DAOM 197198]
MGKTLADSYELLLELVGDLIPIQEKLEDDIVVIQDKLGIIGYTNQERAEEVDEKARAYLQKFEEFHGPLEDVPIVILQKYGEMGVNKIRFTGEGHPLFPNLSPQQLHEIFVKNSANTDQCPYLEQLPCELMDRI